MRFIALDTETTGLSPAEGHRIIEMGCIEISDRQLAETYHCLINPEREIDEGAIKQHGITLEQLAGKPVFSAMYEEFITFVRGAKLLIHNASFDIGFLDAELKRIGYKNFVEESQCEVIDTLQMARERHPGLRNRLDDLCDRYSIDRSARDKHSALLDATLLARVYLAMTGGQIRMNLVNQSASVEAAGIELNKERHEHGDFVVVHANEKEIETHQQFMSGIKPDGS